MRVWTGEIVITLKSDLCAGRGEGFSNGIDLDVCYDAYGLPTIPARRLKGCLRESAELLYGANDDAVQKLFGKSGAKGAGALSIDDAVLSFEHDELASTIGVESYDPQQVLGLYTYLRVQTAIDEQGIADDNTLRVTRVVKNYDPLAEAKGAPLQFTANIRLEIEPEDTGGSGKLEEVLENACKATRNIGEGRNHGLGAVRCKLDPLNEAGNRSSSNNNNNDRDSGKRAVPYGANGESGPNAVCRLAYTIRLDSTMMIPAANGNESIDYIPGTSVLGFFAGKLFRSPRFDELFLCNKVRFSPLYPVGPDGQRSMPSTSLVVKVKSNGSRDGAYCSAESFQPNANDNEMGKPVDRSFSDSGFYPIEQKLEIVYHHSTGDDGTLYTQRCLSEGQELAGFIDGPGDLLDEIEAVLNGGKLSFGRSKTAQYARCSLVGNPHRQALDAKEDGATPLEEGKRYALILDSDAILIDDCGRYRTDFDALAGELEECAGSESGWLSPCKTDKLTSIERKTISGYNAKWNLKKPHAPAIAAGSCVVFTASQGIELPSELLIGKRQGEGFGRVILKEVDEVASEIVPASKTDGSGSGNRAADGGRSRRLKEEMSKREQREELLRETVGYARDRRGDLVGLTNSFIGRITLMAKEAESKADLRDRLESIRNEAKQKSATKLVEGIIGERGLCPDENGWGTQQECVLTMLELAKLFSKQEANA